MPSDESAGGRGGLAGPKKRKIQLYAKQNQEIGRRGPAMFFREMNKLRPAARRPCIVAAGMSRATAEN